MEKNVPAFSKRSTNIVKGIAVILLIIHHMMFSNPRIPVELEWAKYN